MDNDCYGPREPSPLRNAKYGTIFGLLWLGEAFLILKIVKWVTHGSAALYLLMIPWALVGWIIVARPTWFVRATRALDKRFERDTDRLEKWMPPGFP